MSKPIIEVKGLSKKYRYGQSVQPYYTLRDTLSGILKSPKHLLPKTKEEKNKNEFWALKDVSFEVKEGEVLGVIGPNGSGKSTLLKILSQITPPTSGKAILRGRVGSLLEVGTGFHQELTGRENIYLNGAILGMSRREIKKKYDEIVDFSGVEKFLDTPVKRYSSGMMVRLGFAVAAHLDPEILLIDEVLAVGDAEFQKKCLKKIGEVAKGGRTILFVSHNMQAVREICTKCIYLSGGCIKSFGEKEKLIDLYINDINKLYIMKSKGTTILGDLVVDKISFVPNPIDSFSEIFFNIYLKSYDYIRLSDLCVVITNELGFRVGLLDLRSDQPYVLKKTKALHLNGRIEGLYLIEGNYDIGLYYKDVKGIEHYQQDISRIFVKEKNKDGKVLYPASVRGVVNLKYIYKVI